MQMQPYYFVDHSETGSVVAVGLAYCDMCDIGDDGSARWATIDDKQLFIKLWGSFDPKYLKENKDAPATQGPG